MKYIVFGAGENARRAISNIKRIWQVQNIRDIYLVDNYRYDFEYDAYGEKYPVYFPSKLFDEDKNDIVIVVSNVKSYTQIANQLRNMGFMEGKHFFGWPGFTQVYWQETGYLKPYYELRVKFMSDLISKESKSVMDLGCGNMYLKKYLTEGVKYIPCDYVKWDEETVVCDLNSSKFPDVFADTVFMSGILEHIENYENLIKSICEHANKEIIMSYCSIDYKSDYAFRSIIGARNHLSIFELVNMFKQYGMELSYSTLIEQPLASILKFVKEDTVSSK